jgi:cytochrome b561
MSASHYTRTAVGLHWLVAALILAALFMGWTMTEMEVSPQRLKVYNWHKWVGMTVLLLAVVRLAWRLAHRPPPLAASVPAWMRGLAHAGHGLLYLLMLAQPLTGWIYSNYSGYPVVYLGMSPLPNLVERDRELAEAWVAIHSTLGMVLAVVVAGHVLAALYHQFVVRDGTLKRMLAWRAPS